MLQILLLVLRILIEVTALLIVNAFASAIHAGCRCFYYYDNEQAVLLFECIVLFPIYAIILEISSSYILLPMICMKLLHAIYLENFSAYWEKVVERWSDFHKYQEALILLQTIEEEFGSFEQPAVNEPTVEEPSDRAYRPKDDEMYTAEDMQPQAGNVNFNSYQQDDEKTESGNAATSSNLGASTGKQMACREEPQHNFVDDTEHQEPAIIGSLNVVSMLDMADIYDGSHPPGLINTGALCFINCIIQTLSATPHLVDHVDDVIGKGVCSNLDFKKYRFLKEVAIVFAMLTKHVPQEDSCRQTFFYKRPINTANLRKAISSLNDLVADPYCGHKQKQEDAGEFLAWILNQLEEVLVTSSHIPKTQESLERLCNKWNIVSYADMEIRRQQCRLQISQANGKDSSAYLCHASMLSDLEWLMFNHLNKSVIIDIFKGQEVSAIFCDTCSHVMLSFSQFYSIFLPIPANTDTIIEIDSCFRQAIAVNNLSGSDGLHCEFCSSMPRTQRSALMDGEKQMSFSHLPVCLTVQLLRFDSSMRKIITRVHASAVPIDLAFLDIFSVGVTGTIPKFYALYGICLHSGAMDLESGHYISFSLANDGKWYVYDDHKVEVIGNINQLLEDKEIQQNIYILYYKKVN